MTSVHDNRIEGYTVNCREGRIVFHTVSNDVLETTDIIFEGVAAYQLCYDLLSKGNIILDIEQVGFDDLVREYGSMLADGKKYGWPYVLEYGTIPDLIHQFENQGLCPYFIDSTLGMSGFVVAQGITITPIKADIQ